MKPEPAIPVTYVNTYVDLENRSKRDTLFAYFPTICYLVIIATFLYSFKIPFEYEDQPFSDRNDQIVLVILLVVLFSIVHIMTPLYLSVLIFFRKRLLRFYISFMVVSLLLPGVIGFLVSKQPGFLLIPILPLLFFVVFLLCCKKQLKLCQITLEDALAKFKNKKCAVVRSYIFKLFFLFLILSMISVAVRNFSHAPGFNEEYKKPNKTQNGSTTSENEMAPEMPVIDLFMGLSAIAVLYLFETISALFYLNGASFYYESLKNPEGAWRRSYSIANGPSYGTVCFGALIMTLIRMIRNSAEKNDQKNNNLFSGMLLCLAHLLEDALDFLTAQSYIYAAIYGTGLLESAKMGFKSFKEKGFSKFFAWSYSSTLLGVFGFFLTLAITACVTLVLLLLAGFIGSASSAELDGLGLFFVIGTSVTVFIALIIGVFMVNNLVGGAAATQIVLYVEDPNLLSNGHKKMKKLKKCLD